MASGGGRREELAGLNADQVAGLRRILDNHQPGENGWCICGARRCTMRYEAQIMLIGAGIELPAKRRPIPRTEDQ